MTSRKRSTDIHSNYQDSDSSSVEAKKRKLLFFAPTWNDYYVKLAVFKAKYGHCLVPADYTEVEGLAEWVKEQRHYFNVRCKYKDADKDRVRALNVLDFDFQVCQASWEKNYKGLQEYLTANDGQWPKHPNGRGHKTFAHHQRTAYSQLLRDQQDSSEPFFDCPPLPSLALTRKQHSYNRPRPPRLSTDRIQKLEALGIAWKLGKSATPWETRFQELKQFRNENGHTIVPQHYPPNRHLGEWVTRMRYQYNLRKKGKKSQLSEDRIQLLNDVGFQWSATAGAKPSISSKSSLHSRLENDNNDNNNEEEEEDAYDESDDDDEGEYNYDDIGHRPVDYR